MRLSVGEHPPSPEAAVTPVSTSLDLAVRAVAIGIAASTLWPYLAQDARSRPGETFSWLLSAIPDLSSYLMWMDQHRAGAFLVENRMALDAAGLVLPNPVWLALGTLSRVTGMDLVTAFHAGRVALAVAYLWTLWALCKAVLQQARLAVLAFGLAALGSGLGWLRDAGVPVETADWVTELWSCPSILYFPHFAAALALASGGVLCLVRAHRSVARAACAGIAFLLLVFVHPYTAVTLAVALVLSLVVSVRPGARAGVRAGLIALSGLVLGLAGLGAWTVMSPASASWAVRNEMPSPPAWQYLLGLGVPGLVGLAGVVAVARRREWTPATTLCAAWVVAAAVLAHGAPLVPWERRAVEGVHIAVVLLGVAGIGPWLLRRTPRTAAVVVAALVAASLPTNVTLLVHESTAWNPGQVPSDWGALVDTVRRLPEPRTVFTDARRAMHLAAFAGARVFAAHPELTPRFGRKMKEIEDFYDPDRTWEDRARVVRDSGCRYLVLDRADARAMGRHGPPRATRVATGETWVLHDLSRPGGP